jgi:hypothetical protein
MYHIPYQKERLAKGAVSRNETTAMPRMQIFSVVEQNAFGTPPILNAAQRKAVFDLPGTFQKEAEKLRDPLHQIGFWLNAGYFRNGRRCFEPEDFHARDIAYVAARLGHDADLFRPAAYPARTRGCLPTPTRTTSRSPKRATGLSKTPRVELDREAPDRRQLFIDC